MLIIARLSISRLSIAWLAISWLSIAWLAISWLHSTILHYWWLGTVRHSCRSRHLIILFNNSRSDSLCISWTHHFNLNCTWLFNIYFLGVVIILLFLITTTANKNTNKHNNDKYYTTNNTSNQSAPTTTSINYCRIRITWIICSACNNNIVCVVCWRYINISRWGVIIRRIRWGISCPVCGGDISFCCRCRYFAGRFDGS